MEENSKIKAVFFDIDGTLIPFEQKHAPEDTVNAILEIQRKGIKIIICTGRHKNELAAFDGTTLKFDAYITMNGQLCIDGTGKVICGNEIDQGEAEILGKIFEAKKIPFMIKTEDNIYMNYVDDTVIQVQNNTNGVIPDISEYHGEKIYNISAFMDDHKQDVLRDLLDECSITNWNDLGIDIIAKDGGKAKGIQSFLDFYGIKKEETMAFGDGMNDIDMIEFVGIGVAMGNAKSELKAVADYITDDCDKGGISKALKHFGLID